MRSDAHHVHHRRRRWLCVGISVFLGAGLLSACSNNPAPQAPTVGGISSRQPGPLGAYQQQVPIEIPSYYGIAPSLQLAYDSDAGDGFLGVGWSLAGLSAVQRASHGKGVPTYSANDVFYLDGAELLPCTPGLKSPSCAHPAVPSFIAYTSKAEDYRRFALDPSATKGGKWYTWDKGGTWRIYGPREADTPSPYAWDLSRIADTSGHHVDYSYISDQLTAGVGETYPKEITYGEVAIRFYYETRKDPMTYGNGNGLVVSRLRLRAIDVEVDSARVRTYQLAYINHSATGRSVLVQVRQFGKDAQLNNAGEVTNAATIQSLPPTTFQPEGSSNDPWSMADQSSPDWGLPQEGGTPLPVVNGVAFPVPEPYARFKPSNLGDIDGNGRTDWVQAAPDKPSGSPPQHNGILVTAVLAGRAAPVYTQQHLSWPYGPAPVLSTHLADVNADGRSDLVFVIGSTVIPGANPDYMPYYLGIAAALSVGDGHFEWASSGGLTTTRWETRESPTITPDRTSHCLTGDVDGDGRADVICGFTRGDGMHYIGTAWSRGDGSFRVYEEPAPFAKQGETRLMAIGDANGDGLSDPMFLDFPHCPQNKPGCTVNYELVTALATGQDQYDFERTATTWKRGSPVFFAADIDGDGRSDYVLFREDAIQTATRRPDGSYSLSQQSVPTALGSVENSVSVGDANGDGQDDLLVASRQPGGQPGCAPGLNYAHVNLHRVLSRDNGSFNLPASWEDCKKSKELDIPWHDVAYTPIEPQAADLDGDDTADFLIAVAPQGTDVTTLREDLSGPPTGDNFNWRAAERNGDGRKDWVYIRNTPTGPLIESLIAQNNTYITTAQSPAVGTSHFTVQNGWRVMDVNADGTDNLVYPDYVTPGKGIHVGVWLSQPKGGWHYVPSNVFPGLTGRHRNTLNWQVTDVNGDGKSDLTYTDTDDQKGELATWTLISRGDGTWTEKPDQPLPGWTARDSRNWRTVDANGDGKTDLLHITVTDSTIKVHTLLSLGDGTWKSAPASPANWFRTSSDGLTLTDQGSWTQADVNGDGLTDLFHITPTDRRPTHPFSVHVLTLLAHGDGGATRRDDIPAGTVTGDMHQWRLADVTSDRRANLVHVHVEPPAITVTTLSYSHDGGWYLSSPDINVSEISRTTVGTRFKVADVDGNGQDDLTRFDLLPHGMRVLSLSAQFNRDIMTKTTHSTGATAEIAYAASSRSAGAVSSAQCHLPVGVTLLAIKTLTIHPGPGFRAGQESYDYSCPVWSYEQRTFLGWQQILAHRPPTPTQPASTARYRYTLSDECIAQPASSEAYDAQGHIFAKTITDYLPTGQAPPYTCLLANYTDDITTDPSGQSMNIYTYYKYDEYGNIIDIYDYGADLDGNNDERTTTIVYKPAPGPYIVGLPHQVVRSSGVLPAKKVYRSIYYCYDGDNGTDQSPCAGQITKGLLTARKVLNDNGWYDTTTIGYDPYGNVETVTDADQRTTTVTYDPQRHQFPQNVCDASGQCTSYEWDPGIERVRTITDSNNVQTGFLYDALGRLFQVNPQGRASTHHRYVNWGDPSHQKVRVWADDGTSDGVWSEIYLDGLGRPYREVREGDTPGRESVRNTVYADASAAVDRQSHWHDAGAGPVFEVFTYDAGGRPLVQRHPDGTQAQWAYDNDTTRSWQTFTDELNHSTVTYFDAYSRVATMREQAASGSADTTYSYNAADDLEAITDPAGNTTSLGWDMRGDNRSVADPDRGEWTYRYDRTGNTTLQIDGNGQWTRYTYDKAGRIESKTYPSYREVRWYYDEPGHGKSAGRLTSITDTQESGCPLKIGAGGHITKQLFYDTYGRLESSKQCLDGKAVEMKYSYDKLDRLRTITYPDKEVVSYAYDTAGRLKSASGYADQFTYNAAGQVTTTNLSNGVTEINDYDAKREWLNHFTVLQGLSTLFDAGYERYPNGLVKKTTSTTNKMNLTYSYDQANQLTDVTDDYTQHFGYDTSRNITFNSDIGTYDYSAPSGAGTGCGTPAKSMPCPHAVKRIGSTSFGYDAIGNLTTVTPGGNPVTRLRRINWNKDNEPYLLTDDSGVPTRARYDESGQRINRSRGNHVSLYYEPYVDLEHVEGQAATSSIQYYYAGDQLLARKDATGKHWYHTDQIDSTHLVTEQNGSSSASYDYTPFGEPLNNGAGPANADRGFAGHRSESVNDLIYMNARYYLPSLGRFISPNPVIPDIYQSGVTNRYLYAHNNPVMFVDPLGLDDADAGISYVPSGPASPMGSSGGIHNPGPPMLDPTMQLTAPPRSDVEQMAKGLWNTLVKNFKDFKEWANEPVYPPPCLGCPWQGSTADVLLRKIGFTDVDFEGLRFVTIWMTMGQPGEIGLSREPTGPRNLGAAAWEPGAGLEYEFKSGIDQDWRGTGRGLDQAVREAFKETGVPLSEFETTGWGKSLEGKTLPTEWTGPRGAQVSIDYAHRPKYDKLGDWATGPDAPHVGWQTPKNPDIPTEVGHILLDEVPYGRPWR